MYVKHADINGDLEQPNKLLRTKVSLLNVQPWLVVLMALGGVVGALIGSAVSKKISDTGVDKVFMWMLAAIALVNVWNIFRFAMAL